MKGSPDGKTQRRIESRYPDTIGVEADLEMSLTTYLGGPCLDVCYSRFVYPDS